jgi:hypothetical protein
VSLFAADRGTDTGFKKSAAEEVDRFFGGTFVGKAFDFVVGNEVHLCEKTAGVLGKEGGLFWRIVDSCQENIFEEDLFLFGTNKNVTGFEESVEGVPFVNRHNLVADSVAGGMKREGETKLKRVVGKLLDLRCKSAR